MREDNEMEDVSMGGGMVISLDGETTSVSFKAMTFSGCQASYGNQMLAYTTEYLENDIYSKDLWDGLLSGETSDNEFLLAVMDPSKSTPDNPHGIVSSKQVTEVAPPESISVEEGGNKNNNGGTITVIIIAVVLVVVIAVVTTTIIILLLKFNHLDCFAEKGETDSTDANNTNNRNQSEMEESNKENTPPQTNNAFDLRQEQPQSV